MTDKVQARTFSFFAQFIISLRNGNTIKEY